MPYLIRILVMAVACCFFCLALSGQGRKAIKKLRIQTISETNQEPGTSGEIQYKVADEKFNRAGYLVERINYSKSGAVERRTTYSHNAWGMVDEESEYRQDGSLKTRTTYEYNTVGEKTLEFKYDEKNMLVKKHVYSYNNHGLKTERKTFDSTAKLVFVKKYTYTK